MIRKYKKYIAELKKSDIDDILKDIPMEEIEDQFLRIKEVLGCDLTINLDEGDSENVNDYFIRILMFKSCNRNEVIEVLEELFDVENRIWNLYPTIEASIYYNGNRIVQDDEKYKVKKNGHWVSPEFPTNNILKKWKGQIFVVYLNPRKNSR